MYHLQPVVTQLQRQYSLKELSRNIYLVVSIMRFYHGLLTTDQEVEAIITVVRNLKELERDPGED